MLGAVAHLKPVYLIVGSDKPKIGRALRRLRERIGGGGSSRAAAGAVQIRPGCNQAPPPAEAIL